MNKILETGRFYEITLDGFLLNSTSSTHIVSPWDEAVAAAKAEYLKQYGDCIHSIYLRGSIALGTAIEGIADVDTFAMLKDGCEQQQNAKRESEIEAALRARFPFASDFEYWTFPISEIADPKSLHSFIIKTGSLGIYGEDLLGKIPPFRLGIEIQFQLVQMKNHLAEVKRLILNSNEPEQICEHCSLIMKRFLRGGMELVAERAQKFSRDLYPCYLVFSQYYPEQSAKMRQALELVVNPIDSKHELLSFVEKFGSWICDEFEAQKLLPNK